MEKLNGTNLTARNVSLAIYENNNNNQSKADGQCTMSVIQGTPLVVVNSLLVPVGTFGNVLVIFAILNTPQLRQRASNFLLLSLAVADLLVTTIAQPIHLIDICFYTFAKRCNPKLITEFSIVTPFSCTSSIYHLAAISIDRALSTVKPHQHRKLMKKWVLKMLLWICWGAAAIVTIFEYLMPSSILYLTLPSFCLSYCIIICSYGTILYKIIPRKNINLKGTTLSSARERAMQKRVCGTVGIVILLFTLCWAPFWGNLIFTPGVTNAVGKQWISTCYLFNSSINFIVYSLRNHHFRVAYLRIVNRIMQRLPEMLTLPEKPVVPVDITVNPPGQKSVPILQLLS